MSQYRTPYPSDVTDDEWAAVQQQAQRRVAAGCFEDLVHDLRALRRAAAG